MVIIQKRLCNVVFDVDAALMQTQTLYTEATPEQLEQLQQQGIQYDVITFTDE